ncbi:MAG: T9SS type A sorting domain-containing protein, partial [Bacteroidales bacterium]|nr:T9SS type A sorting domain-containing protein [Bacteroidales bacterium]
SVLTASGYTGTLMWSTGESTPTITVTIAGIYTVTQTVGGCTSSPGSGTAAPLAVPSAPIVAVENFCGYSVLTASGYTGTLMWSTGENTPSITVTIAGTYTVTQTVGECISPAGSGTAAPLTIPVAPVVTVENFCGYSVLTASAYTGELLWSTGETTPSITVFVAGTYTVTQTVGGCTSSPGSGTAAPLAVPIAPVVEVENFCGYSILTASEYTGTLMWSTGETTPSITVLVAGTYTVTQTIGGCTSLPGSGIAAPLPLPSAPVVTVENFCGYSVLTASDYTGDLLWSTGETTPSITVTLSGTYTVTQTIGDCTSLPGSGIANPLIIPDAPSVIVENFCGYSVLTASGYSGTLLWNTGETTPAITVTVGGTYTVTQTVEGCTSSPGIGVASPLIIPDAPTVIVENFCGYSVLTAINYSGILVWSTGETSPQITVTVAGTYTVTQTVDGCTSLPGSGIAAPMTVPGAPTVTVEDHCGYSVLTASDYTGTLLWSTGETTPSITVTEAGTYTVIQTIGECTSDPGSGIANPIAIPEAPIITRDSMTLTSNYPDGNQWYYEGTLIEGATGQVYIVTAHTGYYSCTVTINGCTSPMSDPVWVDVVGIPEMPSGASFTIYPVPNNGEFTASILYPSDETFNIVVYNQLGSKIFELKDIHLTGGKCEQRIDLRPISTGIYSVVFMNKDHKVIRKVLVNR